LENLHKSSDENISKSITYHWEDINIRVHGKAENFVNNLSNMIRNSNKIEDKQILTDGKL
jgi:predicted glycosyl hydrolase (DUF1957 family)